MAPGGDRRSSLGVVVLFWLPVRRLAARACALRDRLEPQRRVPRGRERLPLRGSSPTPARGAFAALGGLALTAASGLGDPHSGDIYTLNSVAAVVLGGVSLLGGVGGLIGPIAAAFVLTLVKTIMIIKGVDQNWAQVIQGTLIVLVVMIGGLAIRQKGKSGG